MVILAHMGRAFFAKWIILRMPFTVGFQPTILRPLAEKLENEIWCWALDYADSFSPITWSSLQTKLLRRLLTSAESAPYWTHLFRVLEFSRENLENPTNMVRLPVFTKFQLKNTLESDRCAHNIARDRFVRAATSGSTAEPVALFQDGYDLRARHVGILKEIRDAGAPKGSSMFAIGLDTHRYLNSLLAYRLSNTELEVPQYRKQFYQMVNKTTQPILFTTPSLALRLAALIGHDNAKIAFRLIRCTGEELSLSVRRNLSDIFRSRVVNFYGTRECSPIGVECTAERIHCVPWTNYLEVVDAEGNQLPAGSEGRIIVTSFHNHVMPFIRYDIGDRGRINPELCPCGRTSPTVEFTGRAPGIIELPSGNHVAVLGISTNIAMRFHGEIMRFQMEQSGIDSFIFRFIPTVSYSRVTGESLLDFFKKTFHGELKCSLENVSDIFPNDSGKTPIFIKRN